MIENIFSQKQSIKQTCKINSNVNIFLTASKIRKAEAEFRKIAVYRNGIIRRENALRNICMAPNSF